ncbi:uncharacterized protein LOC116934385 [Daphnia magna]|uniref:uncharacterized protein LOC116934385 n=1 Tax=Daphnia magna TaxID=35525 RepID=UPI001E1BDE7F|nr:uncharacterized protein LOC116934385 [Daphnia magna]
MYHHPPPAKRSLPSYSDEEWPTIGNHHGKNTPINLPPVILKLTDGKANFRQMDMAELKAFTNEIVKLVGNPRRSDCPRGGDLFVYPVDIGQREALLKISKIANRTLTAALPNSMTGRKGIIHRVPVSESEADLLDLLGPQGVTKVERFTKTSNDARVPSETVALTFKGPLPTRVTLVALSFKLHTYYPSPFKCVKCWKLGHTRNHCNSKDQNCKTCGQYHNTSEPCTQKCVNCHSDDHPSDSKECPAYIEMIALIKYATDNDVSVSDARTKISLTYSAAVNRNTATTAHQPTSSAIETLKQTINQLKDQLNELQNSTIRTLQTKIDHVATEASKANKRIDTFEDKFANRFDQLERLLLARLPAPKTDSDNLSISDSESSNSNHSSPKNTSSQSQIHARRDYMSTPAPRQEASSNKDNRPTSKNK